LEVALLINDWEPENYKIQLKLKIPSSLSAFPKAPVKSFSDRIGFSFSIKSLDIP
jgi:hypothetical protein